MPSDKEMKKLHHGEVILICVANYSIGMAGAMAVLNHGVESGVIACLILILEALLVGSFIYHTETTSRTNKKGYVICFAGIVGTACGFMFWSFLAFVIAAALGLGFGSLALRRKQPLIISQ